MFGCLLGLEKAQPFTKAKRNLSRILEGTVILSSMGNETFYWDGIIKTGNLQLCGDCVTRMTGKLSSAMNTKTDNNLNSVIATVSFFGTKRTPLNSNNRYILLDGLAYNTRGCFASCVVFFRAPQGRGKMRAMSKMSARIIC